MPLAVEQNLEMLALNASLKYRKVLALSLGTVSEEDVSHIFTCLALAVRSRQPNADLFGQNAKMPVQFFRTDSLKSFHGVSYPSTITLS
jgi:hypothetical protein